MSKGPKSNCSGGRFVEDEDTYRYYRQKDVDYAFDTSNQQHSWNFASVCNDFFVVCCSFMYTVDLCVDTQCVCMDCGPCIL